MSWFLVGFVLAFLARFDYSVGSGSDDRGDYYFGCLRVSYGSYNVEIDFWPEGEPRG